MSSSAVPSVKTSDSSRVGEEGDEPGKADEDHHRPEPVLGPLPPRDQATPDIRPADDERERSRRRRRARLAVAPEHEQRRAHSRGEGEQRDQTVPPHQPTAEIVHRRAAVYSSRRLAHIGQASQPRTGRATRPPAVAQEYGYPVAEVPSAGCCRRLRPARLAA